jgi:hypothetical protein
MSGAQIASEVAAALREAGTATGNGPLVAVLQPALTGGTPWDAPGATPAPVNVVVVVDRYTSREIDGARILSGDKRVLMEAGVAVPKPGDGLTISGVAHRIENVDPLSPAGVSVMYECQARET